MSDDLNQILVAFTDFKATVTTKLDSIATDNTRADQIHADHETRIRRLERWMYMLTALAAAGGSATGTVVAKVVGS